MRLCCGFISASVLQSFNMSPIFFCLRLNPERISGDFNEEIQVRNIVILLQDIYCSELHAQPFFAYNDEYL